MVHPSKNIHRGLMKKFIFFFISLLSVTSFAIDLADITGTYQVTNNFNSSYNLITLSEDGKVSLIEKSNEGELKCIGIAIVINNILNTMVECENGLRFDQGIDLRGIKNFNNFTTLVYTSLYEVEVPMNFKKL